jgi:hypothetical protein
MASDADPARCLPIADKISVDVRRSDGSLFGKEVPEKMVTVIAMAGNLYDVLTHPCLVVVMDKGLETRVVARASKVQ